MRDPADPVSDTAADAGVDAAAAVLRDMAAAPHKYDFFHALRLIEALHPAKPRLGQARRPVDEPIRLGQAADLSFAASSISRIALADRSGRPRVEVRFFGLFGPNGPLPLHMTSYARERQLHHHDDTFARFADWFHHRLLLLFYRAWAQAQPTVSLDRPNEDRFADYVGSTPRPTTRGWLLPACCRARCATPKGCNTCCRAFSACRCVSNSSSAAG
jgi:type VI secretion system protein ImpH